MTMQYQGINEWKLVFNSGKTLELNEDEIKEIVEEFAEFTDQFAEWEDENWKLKCKIEEMENEKL